MLSKQQRLKHRIRILKKIAKEIAQTQNELGPLAKKWAAMAFDGRKNKSEKFLIVSKAKNACIETIFARRNEARSIYKEFWLIGIDCVQAGRFFQNLIEYYRGSYAKK